MGNLSVGEEREEQNLLKKWDMYMYVCMEVLNSGTS